METATNIHQDTLTVLAQGEGDYVHALDNLVTFKATAGDTGALAAVEFEAPRGFGPPLHCHRDEDELIVVLDGEIAFRSGDTEMVATNGACAYLPHGVPHTFQVLSGTARMLSVTARVGSGAAPQFDAMFRALGEPAANPTLPAPMDIDPGHVALVCGEHGIDVLGPPPAPLAD
jgi:quercetin dioxygenase-like cupin family protein